MGCLSIVRDSQNQRLPDPIIDILVTNLKANIRFPQTTTIICAAMAIKILQQFKDRKIDDLVELLKDLEQNKLEGKIFPGEAIAGLVNWIHKERGIYFAKPVTSQMVARLFCHEIAESLKLIMMYDNLIDRNLGLGEIVFSKIVISEKLQELKYFFNRNPDRLNQLLSNSERFYKIALENPRINNLVEKFLEDISAGKHRDYPYNFFGKYRTQFANTFDRIVYQAS